MRLWLRRGLTGLLACVALFGQSVLEPPSNPAPARTPAFALLDSADAAQWQAWAKDSGWRVIVPGPGLAADAGMDARVKALAAAVEDAVRNAGVDAARVYLAGRGAAATAVFYAVSRMPDAWAAAFALGGSPQQAIDAGSLFAANFTNTPILWAGAAEGDQTLAEKLKDAGLNLEWHPTNSLTFASVVRWLAERTREDFPMAIDCETNSVAFARCYWTQAVKFDPAERNDVLPTTLVKPGSGASLDLGGFGYKADDPGPGVTVASLPDKYSGPLKLGDRIVELDGKPVGSAREYAETMRNAAEEKDVAILVERAKERKRIETRIVLPPRKPVVTARVRANYDPASKEIQIVSRTVTSMRVTVPPHWLPATLNWNGLPLEEIQTPGCIALTIENELLHSEKCP